MIALTCELGMKVSEVFITRHLAVIVFEGYAWLPAFAITADGRKYWYYVQEE